MRWAATLALVAGLGCAHAPGADLTDVVPGELLVVCAEATTPEALVMQLDGGEWRVAYVAAASPTTHLVRVTHADGRAPDARETAAARAALASRGVQSVELNRRRLPR